MTKFTATVSYNTNNIEVEAFADGKRIYGWGLKTIHSAMARRLVKAVEAGVIFKMSPASTITVVKGGISETVNLPAAWGCVILGHMMNSELKRLGF